jgi:transposase
MDCRLSHKQIQQLRVQYRKIKGQRFTDRIRIVLAFAEGFTLTQLSKIFLLDADTIRRYFRSKKVKAYRKLLDKITFVYLPTYSPNLNLIERFWKFFKKKTTYNKYYEKYTDFVNACKSFFNNIKKYKVPLRTLLAPNFHIKKIKTKF